MIELIRQQSAQYAGFADFLAKSLDEPQQTNRLRDMHELFDWIGKEILALVARWDHEHAPRRD